MRIYRDENAIKWNEIKREKLFRFQREEWKKQAFQSAQFLWIDWKCNHKHRKSISIHLNSWHFFGCSLSKSAHLHVHMNQQIFAFPICEPTFRCLYFFKGFFRLLLFYFTRALVLFWFFWFIQPIEIDNPRYGPKSRRICSSDIKSTINFQCICQHSFWNDFSPSLLCLPFYFLFNRKYFRSIYDVLSASSMFISLANSTRTAIRLIFVFNFRISLVHIVANKQQKNKRHQHRSVPVTLTVETAMNITKTKEKKKISKTKDTRTQWKVFGWKLSRLCRLMDCCGKSSSISKCWRDKTYWRQQI